MVMNNSRIDQMVNTEQVTARFMTLQTRVMSSYQKLLGEEIFVVSRPF